MLPIYSLLIGIFGLQSIKANQSDFLDYNLKPKKIAIGFEIGSASHVNYLFEISKILQDRGHKTHYITHDFFAHLSRGYNLTTHVLNRDKTVKLLKEKEVWDQRVEMTDGRNDEILMYDNIISNLLLPSYETSLHSFIQLFSDIKPDLVICDFMSTACLDASEKLQLNIIHGFQTTDLSFPFLANNYHTNSLFEYGPLKTYHLSYWKRLEDNFVRPAKRIISLGRKIIKLDNLRIKNGIPAKRTPFGPFNHLKLFNTFIGFELNKELDSSVKIIGPIFGQDKQKLSKRLDSFLSVRKRVVYLSFGTIFYMPKKHFNDLLQSLIDLVEIGEIDGVIVANEHLVSQEKILVHSNKYDHDINLLDHPSFKFYKYAPQQKLLNHEAVKVFISHGGLMSIFESMHYNVPMLIIPFSVDQPRNARKVEEMGVGIYMDMYTSNILSYTKNIRNLLNDPTEKYSIGLKRASIITKSHTDGRHVAANLIEEILGLADLCKNSKVSGDEKASGWSISHPDCFDYHYQHPTKGLNLIQKKLWDIYLPFYVLAVIVLFGLVKLISRTFKSLMKALGWVMMKESKIKSN